MGFLKFLGAYAVMAVLFLVMLFFGLGGLFSLFVFCPMQSIPMGNITAEVAQANAGACNVASAIFIIIGFVALVGILYIKKNHI